MTLKEAMVDYRASYKGKTYYLRGRVFRQEGKYYTLKQAMKLKGLIHVLCQPLMAEKLHSKKWRYPRVQAEEAFRWIKRGGSAYTCTGHLLRDTAYVVYVKEGLGKFTLLPKEEA